MSIPERLWRVVKGHWTIAGDRLADLDSRLAEAEAYRELAETLRAAPPVQGEVPGQGGRALPGPSRVEHDPLEACYLLLQVRPGAGLAAVDAAYAARLAEIRPEQFAAGSPELAVLEGRRAAVEAAYQKLRDMLNPTETRFERLEF